MTKEIVILPPQSADIAALPLISDLQFLEICSSQAINRKLLGVVEAGIYRGFDHEIGDGLKITVGDAGGANTACVERDGVLLTVQGQHPVELTFPVGKKSTAVIEAFYQYGTATKQVDANSSIDAAAIKVVDFGGVQSHQVILFDVTIPTDTTQITEPMISTERRQVNGLSFHESAANPHPQYVLKSELDFDFGETF